MIEYYILSFLLGMLVAFGICYKLINHEFITEEELREIFWRELQDD